MHCIIVDACPIPHCSEKMVWWNAERHRQHTYQLSCCFFTCHTLHYKHHTYKALLYFYSLSMKWRIITNTSPSREVPSKINDKYSPSISFFTRSRSSLRIKGIVSNMCRVSVNRCAPSANNSLKCLSLDRGTPTCKKAITTQAW